jgi:hypothetical protein
LRWRGVLGILVGVLLPLPLVVVFIVARQDTRRDTSGSVSPVLSREERLQRVTYQRRCQTSAECEPPLGCLKHPRLQEFFCSDSQCAADADCEEGKACQVFITEGEGPRVRACVAHGVRHEGERCLGLPDTREQACAPGLRCYLGWCGRPCRTDAPESCTEGFFCAEDVAGSVCLPTCEARGCPEGQQCVAFPSRRTSRPVSACRRVHGTNCRQSGCAEGQKCLVNHVPERPEEVWMACGQRCAEGQAACAEGLVCHRSYCRQPCAPENPGACGPAMTCGQFSPEGPWVCRPDFLRPVDEGE